MKERFLPIGTVVLLKGGKKEIMITSYCIFPAHTEIKDGKEVIPKENIYDYGGCTYPEGIIESNTVCVFNHSQIEKICYLGYETEYQKALSKTLNEQYENIKEKITNGSIN